MLELGARRPQLSGGRDEKCIKNKQKQTQTWRQCEVVHPMEKTAACVSTDSPTGADDSTGSAVEKQKAAKGKWGGWMMKGYGRGLNGVSS